MTSRARLRAARRREPVRAAQGDLEALDLAPVPPEIALHDVTLGLFVAEHHQALHLRVPDRGTVERTGSDEFLGQFGAHGRVTINIPIVLVCNPSFCAFPINGSASPQHCE